MPMTNHLAGTGTFVLTDFQPQRILVRRRFQVSVIISAAVFYRTTMVKVRLRQMESK